MVSPVFLPLGNLFVLCQAVNTLLGLEESPESLSFGSCGTCEELSVVSRRILPSQLNDESDIKASVFVKSWVYFT